MGFPQRSSGPVGRPFPPRRAADPAPLPPASDRPPAEEQPPRPAWAYLDRAFPAGWNRATRWVEFRAALAPWQQAATRAARDAARRVGAAIASGHLSAEAGEALKQQVLDCHRQIGRISANLSAGQIARELEAITRRLRRMASCRGGRP